MHHELSYRGSKSSLSYPKLIWIFITFVAKYGSAKRGVSHRHHMSHPPLPALKNRQQATSVPLVINNMCRETIYPGLLTQSGTGPGTGGFSMSAGTSKQFTVSEDWQGRVWGRTNCSFNSEGTAPASGIPGIACASGDCGGIINCRGAGVTPVTLAEFTLDPGSGLTYYDISLVDGYNMPLAIMLVQHGNSSLDAIPPSLTNPSCNASPGEVEPPTYNPYKSGSGKFLGTNSSDPVPLESKESVGAIAQWCPWALQATTNVAPFGGIYVYPDMSVNRPWFDPCYSACAKHGDDADCCTGAYDSPSACTPSAYSKSAKGVCPDAYSYAFDDQTSTFIVPSGAGFEVVFCPGARSTNILATSKNKLVQLAQGNIPSSNKLAKEKRRPTSQWEHDTIASSISQSQAARSACPMGLAMLMVVLMAFQVVRDTFTCHS